MGHRISTYSRNQQRTKHNAALKVKIWLVERGKFYSLCEGCKINKGWLQHIFMAGLLALLKQSLYISHAIHYFWPSYCFLKIFIPLGRIAIHVTRSTMISADRKGERVVGQPYNSAEDWFPLTKTGRFLTQLRGRAAFLPGTSQ